LKQLTELHELEYLEFVFELEHHTDDSELDFSRDMQAVGIAILNNRCMDQTVGLLGMSILEVSDIASMVL